jgi:hypothetical protein
MLDQQPEAGADPAPAVVAMLTALGGADGAPTTAQFLETIEEMAMLDHAVHRRIPSWSTRTSRPCTPG